MEDTVVLDFHDGTTLEDAMRIIDKAIDDAFVEGVLEIKIVHGYGSIKRYIDKLEHSLVNSKYHGLNESTTYLVLEDRK